MGNAQGSNRAERLLRLYKENDASRRQHLDAIAWYETSTTAARELFQHIYESTRDAVVSLVDV